MSIFTSGGGKGQQVLNSSGGGTAKIAAGTTNYLNPASVAWGLTAGAGRNILISETCEISKLQINTNSAQPASGSLVVLIQKNNVDTTEKITIAAGSAAGVYLYSGAAISFVVGDTCNVKLTNNASASSAAIGPVNCLMKFT